MANGSAVKTATSKPKGEGLISRFVKFVRESYVETAHKSAWPSSKELRQFTVVVIFAIVVVALWIAGVDVVVKSIVGLIGGGESVQ